MSLLSSLDPFFRDFDRLTDDLLGGRSEQGYRWIPVDIHRHGGQLEVHFDLPGVNPETLEVTVDQSVLSVTAERSWTREQGDEVLLAERHQGRYRRHLFLGDDLETGQIDARYEGGVLTITIPVVESAKPRKVQITTGGGQQAITTGSDQS